VSSPPHDEQEHAACKMELLHRLRFKRSRV
jgi:hypothetical protein